VKRSRVIALSCLLGAIVLFSEMGSAFKLADLFAFHSDNPELTCTITSNGPPTITSNTVTYNSVTVQWPAASESGDGCSGIVYQVTGGPVAYQTTGIAQTVGDLASLTSYTFNVTATDGAATASLGSVSATSVCLITPPTDFIVNNISSSGGNFSANLQWTEPPASTNPYACPSGSGYMTQYQVSGFGTNDPALTTDTQTTVSGLNVGTYQARVVTQVNTGVTGVGIVNSIPTYLILNTSCTVNSSKNLTFSSEKNNATLSWSVPATPYVGNACPNGKVQYQVQGGIPGAPYSTQQTSKKITELQPFSSYQARVTATLGSYQSFPTMITIQTEAKKNYLMLQIASNVIPPVYIYQQVSKKIQQQIGFMSSASAQVFLGEYDPNNTNATYHFYYQDKSNQCKNNSNYYLPTQKESNTLSNAA